MPFSQLSTKDRFSTYMEFLSPVVAQELIAAAARLEAGGRDTVCLEVVLVRTCLRPTTT